MGSSIDDFFSSAEADIVIGSTISLSPEVAEPPMPKRDSPRHEEIDGIPLPLSCQTLQKCLYKYQWEGVKWMHGLISKGVSGGVLADDMGLGKTIQVSFLLQLEFTLWRKGRALVVAPLSLLENWKRELRRWAPSVAIHVHHGSTKRRRNQTRMALAEAPRVVVLTTYGTLCADSRDMGWEVGAEAARSPVLFQQLSEDESISDFSFADAPSGARAAPAAAAAAPAPVAAAEASGAFWDFLVLDEASQIKNPKTLAFKACAAISAGFKLALSGTPLQNRLAEFWAVLKFAAPDVLAAHGELTRLASFEQTFARPIQRAQLNDVKPEVLKVADEARVRLSQLLGARVLRRQKLNQHAQAGARAGEATTPRCNMCGRLLLGKKARAGSRCECGAIYDPNSAPMVISQENHRHDGPLKITRSSIFTAAAKNPDLREEQRARVRDGRSAVLDLVIWLALTPDQARMYSLLVGSDRFLEAVDEVIETNKGAFQLIDLVRKVVDHPRRLRVPEDLRLFPATAHAEIKRLRKEPICAVSTKMRYLRELCARLSGGGAVPKHKVLIFSAHVQMLDVAARVLYRAGLRALKLDGSVKTAERDEIISHFTRDAAVFALLISIGVGGMGLNLTAADRVILLEPSWNPAIESQAIDRANRIGQRRRVVVYRLATSGTVEERMLARLKYKRGLMATALGSLGQEAVVGKSDITGLLAPLAATGPSLGSLVPPDLAGDDRAHATELLSLGARQVSLRDDHRKRAQAAAPPLAEAKPQAPNLEYVRAVLEELSTVAWEASLTTEQAAEVRAAAALDVGEFLKVFAEFNDRLATGAAGGPVRCNRFLGALVYPGPIENPRRTLFCLEVAKRAVFAHERGDATTLQIMATALMAAARARRKEV